MKRSERNRIASAAFIYGTAAHIIGYKETSRGLLSRNAARFITSSALLGATRTNVDAYLAGVASVIIGEGC